MMNCAAKRENIFPYQSASQVQCHLAEAHAGDHYDMYWCMRWREVTEYERDRVNLAARRALEYALEAGPSA